MRTNLIEVCSVNNEHYYANAKIAESLKLSKFSNYLKIPSFNRNTLSNLVKTW